MKARIYLSLFICFLAVSNGFAQATLKFNQTFASQDASKINVDINSDNVTIKSIKGSRIIVETLIKISSPNTRLLEFIAEGGRYNLERTYDESKNELTLISNKLKDVISIKGEAIQEESAYVIYLPETTEFVNETVAFK